MPRFRCYVVKTTKLAKLLRPEPGHPVAVWCPNSTIIQFKPPPPWLPDTRCEVILPSWFISREHKFKHFTQIK